MDELVLIHMPGSPFMRLRMYVVVLGWAAVVLHLAAFNDSTTARLLWHVEGEARGKPVVDSTTAYFLSKKHEVVAIELEYGNVRWRQSTRGVAGQTSGDQTSGSKLLLTNSVVIAGDDNLIAFDRVTGSRRWVFFPQDGYGPGIYLGSSTLDSVFTGSPSGRVYALASASGTLRWSAVVADDGRTTVFAPATSHDLVAAGYTTFSAPNVGGIVAFDIETGRERWRARFPRVTSLLSTGWAGGPVFAGGFVIAASSDGNIYAFNRKTGSIGWAISKLDGICAAEGYVVDQDYRPLIVTGRTLVAGSLTGCVVAYDLDSLSERWHYAGEDDGSVAFDLATDGDMVYVPFADGRLVALTVSQGVLRWRTDDSQGAFRWPPAIGGTRVYAGSSTGFVALLR